MTNANPDWKLFDTPQATKSHETRLKLFRSPTQSCKLFQREPGPAAPLKAILKRLSSRSKGYPREAWAQGLEEFRAGGLWL